MRHERLKIVLVSDGKRIDQQLLILSNILSLETKQKKISSRAKRPQTALGGRVENRSDFYDEII